jgi:DNA modification methylase
MDFKNYIINADCFDEFKNIKDNSIDLVCVDLPYGQTACKWDTVIDLSKMWDELKRICKVECVYVFFCTTKFGHSLISSNKKWFRYDLVWQKNRTLGFLSANKAPLRTHEMIYVFYKKIGTYNPQKTIGKPYRMKRDKKGNIGIYGGDTLYHRTSIDNKGDRYPVSILKFDNPKKSIHKTQKPTDILEWIIKSYSNENDIVLDFTMGSGSTIEVCINTNRRYIGIEKDTEIFNTAKNRIDNL